VIYMLGSMFRLIGSAGYRATFGCRPTQVAISAWLHIKSGPPWRPWLGIIWGIVWDSGL
jgi:hypothetical protein